MRGDYLKTSGLTENVLNKICQQLKQGTPCCDVVDVSKPHLVLNETTNGLVCDIFNYYHSNYAKSKFDASQLVCVLFGKELSPEKIKVTATKLTRLSQKKSITKSKAFKVDFDEPFTFPEWKTSTQSETENASATVATISSAISKSNDTINVGLKKIHFHLL